MVGAIQPKQRDDLIKKASARAWVRINLFLHYLILFFEWSLYSAAHNVQLLLVICENDLVFLNRFLLASTANYSDHAKPER